MVSPLEKKGVLILTGYFALLARDTPFLIPPQMLCVIMSKHFDSDSHNSAEAANTGEGLPLSLSSS